MKHYTAGQLALMETAIKETIEQGKRSVSEDGGTCLYRGPDGLKCAVGHIIPDDLYEPSFEGNSMDELAGKLVTIIPDLDGVLDEFSAIQDAHDEAEGEFVLDFKYALRRGVEGGDLPETVLEFIK